MANMTSNATRVSPADLTPAQRVEYDRLKALAIANRHLEGPPLPEPIDDELRVFVAQLQAAREASGLTLAEVAAKSLLTEKTLTDLEAGAVGNPPWRILRLYAAALNREVVLSAASR